RRRNGGPPPRTRSFSSVPAASPIRSAAWGVRRKTAIVRSVSGAIISSFLPGELLVIVSVVCRGLSNANRAKLVVLFIRLFCRGISAPRFASTETPHASRGKICGLACGDGCFANPSSGFKSHVVTLCGGPEERHRIGRDDAIAHL